MSHRGPDSMGFYKDNSNSVAFAHRRLSIIDLEKTGSQPMQDTSGKFVIVFNGEIYNYLEIKKDLVSSGHHFKSTSDTEVILEGYKRWGKDILSRLNGAFSFAIFDSGNQEIFLARDRAGEKPLYYEIDNGEFYFSSELKGLLHLNNKKREVDSDSLDLYLSYGYIPGNKSLVKDVNKLEAGKGLVYSLKTHKITLFTYWKLPNLDESATDSGQDLLNEVEELLEDSIKIQLRADVPVGILLSGGIDSSLITALATRGSSNISSYTASFSEWGNFDESKHAKLIANHFGIPHEEINVGKANPQVMDLLSLQFDEPMADSSMIPTYLLTKEVKKSCTVVLGGDGGDELFGGYQHYDRLLLTEKISKLSPYIIKNLSKKISSNLPSGFKGKNWVKALGHNFSCSIPLIGEFFDKETKSNLFINSKFKEFKDSMELVSRRGKFGGDIIQNATRFDFGNYLVEDILVKIDRASMLNSLEMRAPFLDYRLIEFAYGKVPRHMKVSIGKRKILLKLLASRILPKNFDLKRKQGFSMPLKEMLSKGEWRDYFLDNLKNNNSLFQPKVIDSLFHGIDKGRNNQEKLFSLLLLEQWKKNYKISF